MVLMRGVSIGTMYNILRRIDIDKCVNVVCHESNIISSCLVDFTMLWHQWMGHIGEKGLHTMHSEGIV